MRNSEKHDVGARIMEEKNQNNFHHELDEGDIKRCDEQGLMI